MLKGLTKKGIIEDLLLCHYSVFDTSRIAFHFRNLDTIAV